MSGLRLSGRVVRAADLAPAAGVTVRFIAPAAALKALAEARPLPPDAAIWTRHLTGFAGSRWDCWVAHVKDRVKISWDEFSATALSVNPHLAADGRLFKPEKRYLIPEPATTPTTQWTGELKGFKGSRWDCWVAHIKDRVNITWEEFCDQVLARNPHLAADGRLFQPEKSYTIPEPAAGRALITAVTDASGNFAFAGIAAATAGVLQVTAPGFAPVHIPVVLNADLVQPVSLQGGASLRSTLASYAALPPAQRTLIDQALALLGDEKQVFDSLPEHLQRLCYGYRFRTQPEHPHYKDMVCADLVSIAFAAAGLSLEWNAPGGSNPHLAHHYTPGAPGVVEISDANDWQPGDVLVFGNPGAKAGHVVLYVGPYAGTDRNGRAYPAAAACDIVEASMNFDLSTGGRWGLGNIGLTRQQCLSGKRGYQWVRRVRLKQLQ